VTQQFAALQGSHPADQPVPNRHIVELTWHRTLLHAAYSIDDAWTVSLQIPYDVKEADVRYELPDGTPFDNPLGDVHHRTETLSGLSDLRILAAWNRPGVALEGDRLTLAFGLSLPTGRTEDDPYVLGQAGIRHQHIQFGTGSVDPLAQLGYSAGPMHVQAGVHAPLYENPQGYRGPVVVDWAVGPIVALAEEVSASLHYTGIYQGRAYWDGHRDPNSGYLLHGVTLALPVRLGRWTLRPTVLYVLEIDAAEGDSFELEWMFSMAVEADLE
jgi:hypothetical protein